MPILKDFRTTKVITLPSFPDSKVEIFDSLIVGQMVGMNYKSDNVIEQIIESLPHFIKSWNFTDDKNVELVINRENLNFLKMADLEHLANEIMAFSAEVKKKQNPSPPSQ